MDNQTLTTLLIGFGLCCVLPLFVMSILALFAINRLQKVILPDPTRMQQEFETMRVNNPNLERDKMVQKIIHRQALKTGVIGALTGLGGFITIPIALPIDLYTSLKIQAAMVTFIGYAYGHTNPSDTEERIKTVLVMSGSSQITRTTTKWVTNVSARFLGKTLAKLLPFVGAAISFGVNYLITRSTGHVAARWYASQEKTPQEI